MLQKRASEDAPLVGLTHLSLTRVATHMLTAKIFLGGSFFHHKQVMDVCIKAQCHAIISPMTSFALLFTLSAIGVSETVYLIRTRIASEKPVCPIGGDCVAVLTSKYRKMFLVPNDALGLFAYIVIAFLSAFLVIGVPPVVVWGTLLTVFVAAASLMSLLFTYLQWRVIRAWCFWCLMSAFTMWLMGIILMVRGAL